MWNLVIYTKGGQKNDDDRRGEASNLSYRRTLFSNVYIIHTDGIFWRRIRSLELDTFTASFQSFFHSLLKFSKISRQRKATRDLHATMYTTQLFVVLFSMHQMCILSRFSRTTLIISIIV